ncbi:MAG: efflux RND transporter periplasmic adaptor subunit [Candidatus Omnitrophota bacterium]|nr:efflux RND transporter periplasmic adaptor subunit [Candidatus Omnitrophota bacterium]
MPAKFKRYTITVFFIFAALFISACEKKAKPAEKQEAIAVRVERIQPRDIRQTLDYVGNIRAKEEALIYSRVPGKLIEKVREDSSSVDKGDVIAYIDRDEVGFKFEKAPVESPIKGTIGRFYCDIGQNVTEQTPIALVVDMEKVEIILNIPEKYLPRVRPGETAYIKIDAYPGESFPGKVTKVSPVLDLDTRTAPIEISVDNPRHRLSSGMFAEVSLVIQERKAVPVILKEALAGRGVDSYVYIIKDERAVQRKVQLGLRQGPYYEVSAGLEPGDMVVIMGQQRLYDGASVVVEEEK